MERYKFKDGDLVLLIDKKRRERMVVLRKGQRFALYGRQFLCDCVIGRLEAEKIILDEDGRWAYAFRPALREYVINMKRDAQPIYPKDWGILLHWADVRSGDYVLEVGLGAGGLSIAILNAIGPSGKLVTYERREDFASGARKRVEKILGKCDNFEIVVKDASLGIEEEDFDAAFIDVPQPWDVVESVWNAVKFGRYILAFIPTTVQVKRYWDKLRQMQGFFPIEIFELLMRFWDADVKSLRPSHRMVAHTGFVVVARKVDKES